MTGGASGTVTVLSRGGPGPGRPAGRRDTEGPQAGPAGPGVQVRLHLNRSSV